MSDEDILTPRGYELSGLIGEGAYSKVRSAFSSKLRQNCAIKCIDKRNAPDDFVKKFLPRELEILPRLNHKNIIKVYEILAVSDGRIFIIMDYAAKGDLLRFIQKNSALSEPVAQRLFCELASAVAYCHELGYCHRDLKCENILLSADLSVRLTDFGFARRVEFDESGEVLMSSTFCGSAAYAAPEIIQGKQYDPRKHDSWSLGVILYIMVCGSMPYDDSNVRKMLKDQLRQRVRFPSRCSSRLNPDIKDLIWRLICVDVKARMHVSTLHLHQWIRRPDDRRLQNKSTAELSRVNIVDQSQSTSQEHTRQ